jgi:hypothetical protein
MRKKIWSCAISTAVAGVTCGLALDYAYDHPQSWLGCHLFNAPNVAVLEAKGFVVTSQTAGLTFQGVRGLLGQPTAGVSDCAPPDTTAAAECPTEPAVLPGAISMHEDAGARPAQPMPPIHDLVGDQAPAGGGEECEPAPMPRAHDDGERMPRADDLGAMPTRK